MPSIHLHHITKSFDTVVAVNDVSLSVGDGEMVVLVGPSGCGKTTLLRLIAGLERADAGEIYFGDVLMNEIRPKYRNLSIVFQDYALLPHINVFENIAYGLRSRGTPRKQIGPKVSEAARRFRVERLLERWPSQLSGGERQRVALARAMVRDSVATLYDEPLASLDAPLRQQARADIMQLHQQKQRPSVYVTHDQSEAMAMGDRIAVMRAGRIVQLDAPMMIYSNPVNRFVADFIGAGMNWFEPAELPFAAPTGAVIAGVRPEHVGVVNSAETANFSGILSVRNGRHCTISVARRDPVTIHTSDNLVPNATVYLRLRAQHLLWFDASGNRVNGFS